VWYVLYTYTVAALLFWLQHSLSPGQFNPVNHPIGRGEMPERGLTGAGPLAKDGPMEHARRCPNLASTGKRLAVFSISTLRYSGPYYHYRWGCQRGANWVRALMRRNARG
jgi:hypothetical protein